ncbi:hypothetical protein [Saccharothrix algeriensis]|uniref:PPE family domain-containing protein n=2 Tax=Saccharothrix algeriensis TaxID=173560 RepID=A0ABS2S827_9PSEU|nr:hypothetical protein [Saccharothrix algeriensis]MBM7812005.1 hypothetical protein [Saccharothrix algeriensis]
MSDDRRGGYGGGQGGPGDHVGYGGPHGGRGNHGGGGHGGGHGSGHGGHGNEPPPSDLGQKVDWMTYSHQALYDMVHTGVDLRAAGSAQADWAAVGTALGDVQKLLAKAISQSQQAWAGQSADLAREALVSVEKWALNTSDHAENVARCIGDEIQHVQTAREMMPAPAPAPPVVEPVPAGVRSPLVTQPELHAGTPGLAPDGVYQPSDGGRALPSTGASSPFQGVGSVSAPVVDSVLAADATHRQAAEVMAMFQQNSYAVDRTVPSFSPPTNPVAPTPPPSVPGPPGAGPLPVAPPGDGGPVVVTNPNRPPAGNDRGTTNPQQQQPHQPGRAGGAGGGAGAGAGGLGVGGRGRFAPGRGGAPVPVGASGGGGAPAPLGSPGSSSGVLGPDGGRSSAGANPGSVTSQFQSPKSVTPHSGMIGAAPMAAPPPVATTAGGNERSRPGYLEEDENLFGVDRKAAPPVIGL